MSKTLKEAYGKYFQEMLSFSKAPDKIDETNIYQEANPDLLKYAYKIADDAFRSDSCLNNIQYFKEFYDLVVNQGKTGVVMMEHYSNLDLPGIKYLLDKINEPWATDFSNRIVAIAGMKLNEANPALKCWTEAFTRVVIYPTRSLSKIENSNLTEEEIKEEEQKARKINFAAMRQMDNCKRRGQIIVVFPSGTRYRPGKPETKTGLREIDSYLRLFDVLLPVSINGNALQINPESPEDMLSDLVVQEKIELTACPIVNCKEFRNQVLENLPENIEDPKQKTVDAVMDMLQQMHDKIEAQR